MQESDYEENECQNESSLNITATQPAINNSQSEFSFSYFNSIQVNKPQLYSSNYCFKTNLYLSQDFLQFSLKTYFTILICRARLFIFITTADFKELEAFVMNFAQESTSDPVKTWQEKQHAEAEDFQKKRREFYLTYISSHALISDSCDNCTQDLWGCAIRCKTCCKNLCRTCDYQLHSTSPFHHRLQVSVDIYKSLLPTQFHDTDWNEIHSGKFSFLNSYFYLYNHKSVFNFSLFSFTSFILCNIFSTDVAVPCMLPQRCLSCLEKGTLKVVPSSEKCVVIHFQGTFLLNEIVFYVLYIFRDYLQDVLILTQPISTVRTANL